MTMDIREAFLHDTEEGDLDRPGKRPISSRAMTT
jgi:hypothetical protein